MSHRLPLLGGEVDALTPASMLAATEAFVAGGGTAVIANHNLHSLALLATQPRLRDFFDDADLVQIDSVPMIAWAKLVGLEVGREHRSTYLDWREDFWARASECGWRVFHVGGAPGVGEKARQAILERHPGVQLAEHHGYFNVQGLENHAVLRRIAEFGPDVILAWACRVRNSGSPKTAGASAGASSSRSAPPSTMRPGCRSRRRAGWVAWAWSGCSGWSRNRAGWPIATWSSPGS
jgi:UDP-N-acetyl-D-mannosaminuronic acid transferase (WecB/TagA/CpsF family)